MIGMQMNTIFLDLAKVEFKCPRCKKDYNDSDDKYLNRCNKNKSWATRIKCQCGKSFYMTYDMMGDAVTFLK